MPSEMTITDGKYGRRASLGSAWTQDTADHLADHQVVELELNVAKGWKEGSEGLSFLSELPFLKSFEIFNFGIEDISPIHTLLNLRSLDVTTYCKTVIDFSKFPLLESCGLEWRPKSESIFQCVTLKELFVNRYKGKSTDSFSNLVNLEALQILNAPVTNLRGLRPLAKLRKLRIANLRQLCSLEGIEKLSLLESLLVQTCRKISTLDELGALTNLRSLDFDDCGEIASLGPLRKLEKLERLGFSESTRILDDNMNVLLELKSLRDVSFQNRRKYTHTSRELNAILAKRDRVASRPS